MTDPNITNRLDRGDRRFTCIENTLAEIKQMLEPLPKMQADVAETKGVVEAWNTAKNVGRFTRWLAGVIIAVSGILGAIKLGIVHLWRAPW